ncbi:DNA-binding protein [Vibrio sp. YMD68]|uniref:PPC domain-containing DNA-binding protein n=1 Tax=Vibrio sp. YMD68 TaxID=3042300 RepID=UPI00249C10D5|nr:PPC domain-containing DNA-binding protein [Vibrio sp. YMD68]WGV98341.1 DNA-binding protein [Vibrio sp. YMD68]
MLTPIAVRLTQGTDLKHAVKQLITQHNIQAGSIASCVGCLSSIHLRLAGATETLQMTAPFEIVSLMGTLTPDHQHIHISVSDNTGQVLGGHLLDGNIIDTTAELIIHHYPNLSFTREEDANTGFTELVVHNRK